MAGPSRLPADLALEVLHEDNTFFARMTQCGENIFSFEEQRFRRWLKSMYDDSQICEVRNVTFGVEWSSLEEHGRWERRTGNVEVRILLGGVTVLASQRIAECPSAPCEQIRKFISKFLGDKVEGEGLGYEEWIAVWDKVQALMASGWGSPYWKERRI
jgi:hypothetical protein